MCVRVCVCVCSFSCVRVFSVSTKAAQLITQDQRLSSLEDSDATSGM